MVFLILMDAWVRSLVEPAKTPPTDYFRWKDDRSKSKQVVNGFRIAGGLIEGFAVMMAVLLGLSRLSEDQRTQNGCSILVSWIALVAAALIVVWTANRWAPFVTGFFFGPALLKLLGVLVVGDDSYYSAHSMTRTWLAEFLEWPLVSGVIALFVAWCAHHLMRKNRYLSMLSLI